jgi:hypothetical protein
LRNKAKLRFFLFLVVEHNALCTAATP